jgi:hypothetical protein
MNDFNAKLASIHREIQQDTGLVRRIYEIAGREGLKSKYDTTYFPVETFNEIPLGLDLNNRHTKYVFEILAKMRIIYDVSEGNADLLCVYASLDNNIGILSEDADVKSYFVDSTPLKKLNPILAEIFVDPPSELEKTTFWVEGKVTLRTPIVDLDHVFVKPGLRQLFNRYTSEYRDNPEFIIHRV